MGRKPLVRKIDEQKVQREEEEVMTEAEEIVEEVTEEVTNEEVIELPPTVMTTQEALLKRVQQKVVYSDGFTNVILAAEAKIAELNNSGKGLRFAIFPFGSRGESENSARNANYEILNPAEAKDLKLYVPDNYVIGYQSMESFTARKAHSFESARALVGNSKTVDGAMVSEQSQTKGKVELASSPNVMVD